MFTQRLRLLLVGLFATATVVTTTVGIAAPANADPGTTCTAPEAYGQISRTYSMTSYTSTVRISAAGFTTAWCPTAGTDYKYELYYLRATPEGNVDYSQNELVARSTSVTPSYLGRSRNGTDIAFPDVTFNLGRFSSTPGIYVGIASYSKPWYLASYSDSPTNTDWYYLSSTGDFATASMQSRPTPGSCKIYAGKTNCG